MSEYRCWRVQPPRGGCVLDAVRNFDGLIDMKRGRTGAIAAHFPPDVELVMSARYPKDVKLYDQLHNFDRLLVCSPALTTFLTSLDLRAVEFLPVRIIDHKSRVASTEFSIVNPYTVFDCIDRSATQIEWNDLDPDLICGVMGLAFDRSKIDPAVPMFRVKHMAHYVFVVKEVADRIMAQGFVGPVMLRLDAVA